MSSDAVTILITDMEGSTAFTEARGDERAMEILRTHERITREVIGAHGGRAIKSMGDGFMVAFSEPASAVACALDLMAAFSEHNASAADVPINVRAGINSGPVIEEGGDLYGTTVNAASRIVAKARSGQVLVAESVRETAHAGVSEFVDRGLFWLKGLRERWRLYEARGDATPPVQVEPVTGRTPFVDREDERASLRTLVDAALDGRGGIVFLTGESGAGKTRLAEEMGSEAAGRGMSVLVGRCYEATSSHPYAPIVEVLEQIQRESEPELFRAALGEVIGEIARIMPQIRRSYPDIPPPTDLPPEQERRFLFVSLRAVLAALAQSQPRLILLDDIHWADEPTLLLLEQLAADLGTMPVLIVVTYPHTGRSRRDTVDDLIGRLERRRVLARFSIGPIPEAHAAQMIEAIVGCPAPAEITEHLYTETGGNAFFLEEVVRHLLAEGQLLDGEGRWLDDAAVALDVPETVRLVIGKRLAGLSSDASSILTLAAVIGRAFGFELLDDLAGLSEDELLDGLDEAERAGLIASTSDAGYVRFRFAHELVRQALLMDISASRRQVYHLRVADSIERVFADRVADHASDMAYHLVEAGRRADPARVLRFSILAGERALDAAAYEEALRHLEHALGLVDPQDHRRRAEVLELLGMAERSLGHLDEAIAAWVRTLDEFEALDDRDAIARLCLDAGFQIALWRTGRHLRPLITRGLAAIGDRRTGHRGGLLALSAALASDAGNYEGAQELFDEAVDLARESGDANVLGLTLYVRCYHHHMYQEFAKCIELGEEAIELLRKGSDVWTLANAIAHVGSSYSWSGKFERGAVIAEEAKRLGQKLGNWSASYTADRARSFRRLGRQPDLRRLEDDGLRDDQLGRQLEIRWLTATGRGRMALAAFWQGRWDDALAWYTEAAALESSIAGGGHHARLALCHAYMGHRPQALELIDAARPIFPQVGRANTTTAWLAVLMGVETLAVLGERDAAAELYPVVVDARRAGILLRPWDFRIVETLAGVAASCARDWAGAERHFTAALEIAHELPERIEVPEVRRFLVRMLLDRDASGDDERARRAADLACGDYATIGMPKHIELVRTMLT